MITIMLVDDHKIVRQGIRALMSEEPDFKVVGEAASGREALPLLKSLQPDVLVTDLKMPDMSGIELVKHTKAQSPRTRSVVLSMYTDVAFVSKALEAGALGYVVKESSVEDLATAIRKAAANHQFLSPPISMADVEKHRKKLRDSAEPPDEETGRPPQPKGN